jgi:zinc protease
VTLEDPAEKGFITDSDEDEVPTEGVGQTEEGGLPEAPPSAAVADLSALDVRPAPGAPREYHFPRFVRFSLANGLTVLHSHVPGRALIAANLLIPGGGWTEAPEQGGVTVLTSRALAEGTLRRDADEFIEASERLGAEIHAETTWEALTAGMEVPRSHFGPALALLAEMVFEPAFPESEVERLREERMNDLLQAWSDPRRRAERVFPETIFGEKSPYRRPLAGVQTTVRVLTREHVMARHAALVNPATATLVVAGDLGGQPLEQLAQEHLGQRAGAAGTTIAAGSDERAVGGNRVVLVDKPGAPQSELRIGHVGVARKNPDFHAISVLNAILGGTFNSRLNTVLREEKGYTYGIGSSFDMRRQAGPFVVRTAVETAVTLPAINEILRIVREFGQADVGDDELSIARDYLVGVFPLRFETASQVASALGGLVALDLPDDELDRYRPGVAAVSAADVRAVANRYIRPDELVVVVVGDAARVEPELSGAGLGDLTVVPADASPE